MASLVVPCANHIVPTRLSWKQNRAGASSQGSEKKPQTSFRWWQKSSVEPKLTGTIIHLHFAPFFTVTTGVCLWWRFSVGPTKLLGCSAQARWQDIENVSPGLSAVLQLHGIFHSIWPPERPPILDFSSLSQYRLRITPVFQLENVRRTEVIFPTIVQQVRGGGRDRTNP